MLAVCIDIKVKGEHEGEGDLYGDVVHYKLQRRNSSEVAPADSQVDRAATRRSQLLDNHYLMNNILMNVKDENILINSIHG